MFEQIEATFGHLPPFWWNMILVGIAIGVGLLLKLLLGVLFRRKANKEGSFSFLHNIIDHLSGPITHFLPLLILGFLLPEMRLPKTIGIYVSKCVTILIIVSFAAVLIQAIKVMEDYFLHRYDIKKTDNLQERRVRTQLQFVRRFIVTGIILIAVCAILLNFESVRKIGTGLLTGVGVGGIIIGFAAQKSLGNFFAGFQIAFTQPLRIDDVLVVEGEFGNVEEITLSYVVLRCWDSRTLILPITYFIEKPFQNWTRNGSAILSTVYFYLDHTAPVDALRKEFLRLVNENDNWDKRASGFHVTNIKENVIEVRGLVSALNSGKAFDLCCFLREKMLQFIVEKYPDCLPQDRAVVQSDGFNILDGRKQDSSYGIGQPKPLAQDRG